MLKKLKKGKQLLTAKFKLNDQLKRKLIILLTFLILVLFFYNYKHLFVVALVNNRPITRLALVQKAEKQAGQQILDTLVTKSLILQEGKKQKVEISKEEIEGKIEEIEEQVKTQGTDLDTLLETQGLTREELEEEIEIQLIIEKILGKDIQVSDEEVENYFEENEEFLGEGVELEEIKEDLREQMRQEQIGQKIATWIDELKQEANISYFLKF